MYTIDSHQHFWEFDPVRDSWIDESMQVIRRDFTPDDLRPLLKENGIDSCIAVQADQSEQETEYLLVLASQFEFIKGVVGWVDLLAEGLTERLSHYANNPYCKGIRHIAQSEEDDFLCRKEVINGISKLEQFDLTYDILIYAHQLPAAYQLVKQLPEQAFVLDHIAKPRISQGVDGSWTSQIKKLASCPNVYCKVSGMVTETTHYNWSSAEFTPFMDVIVESFGVDRIMYGSDWPVCLLAADYHSQLSIVTDYLGRFSITEQAKVMGENAKRFYNL